MKNQKKLNWRDREKNQKILSKKIKKLQKRIKKRLLQKMKFKLIMIWTHILSKKGAKLTVQMLKKIKLRFLNPNQLTKLVPNFQKSKLKQLEK